MQLHLDDPYGRYLAWPTTGADGRDSGTLPNESQEYIAQKSTLPSASSMRVVKHISVLRGPGPAYTPFHSGFTFASGSTALQNPFTLRDGNGVRRGRIRAEWTSEFAPRLSFSSTPTTIFRRDGQVSRRTPRWAKVCASATEPKTALVMLRFHTQTAAARYVRSPTESWRVTMQALAAVLGGTNSLTPTRDERCSST